MVASSQSEFESIGQRAEKVYCEKLRAVLEPTHFGQYVVINVETGEYEVDADEAAASDRAAAKHPSSSLFTMRVGHRVSHRIGYAGRTTR